MTTGRTRGAITEPNNVILIAGAQSLRGEQYFITGGKDRTIKLYDLSSSAAAPSLCRSYGMGWDLQLFARRQFAGERKQ